MFTLDAYDNSLHVRSSSESDVIELARKRWGDAICVQVLRDVQDGSEGLLLWRSFEAMAKYDPPPLAVIERNEDDVFFDLKAWES